jgi:hypothetical protein
MLPAIDDLAQSSSSSKRLAPQGREGGARRAYSSTGSTFGQRRPQLVVREWLCHVLYPCQPLDSLRPSECRHCQQCDMLQFGSRDTFGQSSTSVRMDGTMRVGSDRKCEMDKPLGPSIKWPRLVEGCAKLLKGGPYIWVVLRDVLRSVRQGDRRIFGDISRRLFHWSSLMCGSVSDASYRIWIAYCRHSSTSGSPALPEPTTRSSCRTTRRCWTPRANSLRSSSSRRNPSQTGRSPKSVSNRCTVTRPKCCRGIGENLECWSGRSRTACMTTAHSRAEGRRRRESVHVEFAP